MATLPTRPPAAAEPYYQHDVYLGDVPLPGVSHPPGRPVGLHLRLHVAEEPYRGRRELVPLRHAAGTRVYVHARPYVLVPDYRLTVALPASRPTPGEAAGRATPLTVNQTAFSLGTAAGSALGSALLAAGGYTARGLGLPVCGLAGALLLWLTRPSRRRYPPTLSR